MFNKDYWKSSAIKLKDIRFLALMAAFIAMKIVLGNLFIPVSSNLRIYVTFVITAIESAIMGPIAGITSAAVTDILSFILFPDGPFFPGYTLTAMVGSFIYAVFLYQQKITITRIAIAKTLNNYLVNVLMGSLWSAILYDKAYIVYASASLIKNTLLLPLEILLLTIVFNLLAPVLIRKQLIKNPGKLPISWK